jgi:hypothetical protein
VAVVQYTYTLKQNRARHKTKNTWNNTKTRKNEERAPSLWVLPWHLPYNCGKKHGRTSFRVAIHKHKIRIHSHNNNRGHYHTLFSLQQCCPSVLTSLDQFLHLITVNDTFASLQIQSNEFSRDKWHVTHLRDKRHIYVTNDTFTWQVTHLHGKWHVYVTSDTFM